MGPRIVFVGGGSHQWTPTLVVDIANTPSLADAEIVLEDVDGARLPRMATYVEHVARRLGIAMTVRTSTHQREALAGADFVVVCISTGGLTSMAVDLDVSARHGLFMPGGDTVGPAGISRALRNIPALLSIARDMEAACPDAWMLNLTNPMTTLCRAVTRETSIKTVGLCHEVLIMRLICAGLLDAAPSEIDPVVTGVNHLPVVTELRVGGSDDGLARLRDLVEGRADASAPLPWGNAVRAPRPVGPGQMGDEHLPDATWTKQTLLDLHRVNFEILRRFGALTAAGPRHTVEFFPDFLTGASDSGRSWGSQPTTIAEREQWEARYVADLDARLASDDVARARSMEMLAPVLDSLVSGKPHELPLNLPNRGQCADLPPDVVVESMCLADGNGIRGRDVATAPPLLAEVLRRVVASQELTVEAACRGNRDTVFAAMLADPYAATIDYERLGGLVDALLAGTARWLPQFAT